MVSPDNGSKRPAVSIFGTFATLQAVGIRGFMLYEAYQIHHDVLGPVRLMAEALRGFLDQPWPLISNAPMLRSAAAAMELLSNAGMSHNRPDFDIRSVVVDGREVAVTEEVIASDPFCNLLHFRKEAS